MNARQLRQILPILHAFAYRGVVEYKPLDGNTWTRINPDTTEFRPKQINPLEWRWTPTMPDDWEIAADYNEAELSSRIEEREAELDRLRKAAETMIKASIVEMGNIYTVDGCDSAGNPDSAATGYHKAMVITFDDMLDLRRALDGKCVNLVWGEIESPAH